MSNFHYVYIRVDEATGNHFYIGCTEDLKSRLENTTKAMFHTPQNTNRGASKTQ